MADIYYYTISEEDYQELRGLVVGTPYEELINDFNYGSPYPEYEGVRFAAMGAISQAEQDWLFANCPDSFELIRYYLSIQPSWITG